MSLNPSDPQTSCNSNSNSLCEERRQSDRWDADGVATAFELGGERFGRMHELRVVDYSPEGMGVIAASPLDPGSQVSIGFQATARLARRGTVTRCRPCDEGYHIGIQFDSRLAA